MIQEKEVKDYVKEILESYYQSLEQKRKNKGKLLQDEEIIYQAIKDPTRGDIKILVIYDSILHVFIESKRHPGSYFSVMNDLEARRFIDRRPFDYYIFNSDPKNNYNLYLCSASDNQLILKSKEFNNKWQFYSIELKMFKPIEKNKEIIPENLDNLSLDQKWDVFKKLPELDPRKKELQKEFYGFKLKYKKYKQPAEEEKFLLIEPHKIKELVGMISREIYPINLRDVLRRDYKKEHIQLIDYTKNILNSFLEEVQRRKNLISKEDYLEYLKTIENEIQRQILLLE